VKSLMQSVCSNFTLFFFLVAFVNFKHFFFVLHLDTIPIIVLFQSLTKARIHI
ncbi:hypothetical protein ACJX0J_013079, partial [Zea mays]